MGVEPREWMGLPGFGPESQAPKARRIPSYPTAPSLYESVFLIKI